MMETQGARIYNMTRWRLKVIIPWHQRQSSFPINAYLWWKWEFGW